MPIFNGTLPELDMKEAKRCARLKTNQDFSDDIAADACMAVQAIAKPCGIFQQCYYDSEAYTLLCDAPFTIAGKQVRDHLGDAEIIVVMAVTIGGAVEDEIDHCFLAKEYTKGLMLDAAATTATEMVADQLNRYIDEIAAKKGYKTTWRYSPGYGDWPLNQQIDLVKALHADQIGISVTESMMLVPRKSITAIIGLKRDAATGCGPNSCAGCSMSGCHSRMG